MAWSLLLITLLATAGDPAPATTTTTIEVPASPAAGLSLEPGPAPTPQFSLPLLPPPPAPPARLPAAWTAMAAGMAVLAGRWRRISGAEHSIRRSLQDNLFHDVGHQDLDLIATTLAGLEAGEANAVVASLTDRELAVWLRELDGWKGGFDEAEEAALFASLAGSLSPAQLARLVGHGKSSELIEAVAAMAPGGVRADTALALWAGLHPADDAWSDIIDLFESASLRDQESSVARTVPGPLMVSLLGIHPDTVDTPRVRLETLDRFLATAAAFTDPRLKAEIFVAGQAAITRRLHPSGAVDESAVGSRLGALVRSDPTAVVVQLSHGVDPHADVFGEWVQDRIEADRLDELDVLLAALLGSPNRLAHFADPGEEHARPFPHAANLGYYVGAYSLAIDGMADAAEDQITLVGQLFSIVTGQVPGPDGTWIRLPVGTLVDVHARDVVKDLRSQATTLKQALWGLAKPRSADGLLWNGAGTTQFQDAWEEVVAVR